MSNSIQWPKAGDVLGDFILESPREITNARARYLAIHEPSDKKALITCGTSPLDSNRFVKKATELFICQFRGAARIADAKCAGDFYWIASEYIECEPMPAALLKRMAGRNPKDIEIRSRLAMVFGLGIGQTLERFQRAGLVHGELDPFRTALGLKGDRFGTLIYETGFNDVMDYDYDRARAHPLFCAPEQLHGHPPSIQTDLYACAMIMRVLMLGSPFSNDPDQLLRQCQEERLTPLKQSWPNLRRVSDLMDAALEKDPANRPRDWHPFLEELSLFMAEIGLSAPKETRDEGLNAPSNLEPERSSVPAKSKVKAQEALAEPATNQRERLKQPAKGRVRGAPLSLVGRAGKTQMAYFQASSDCGPFRISKVLQGLGEFQRYQATEKQSQKEALLLCGRARDGDRARLEQWAKKRAGVSIKYLPALLDCGVDEGFYFIGEEMNQGAAIGEALAPFAALEKPMHALFVSLIAGLVATVMHQCAEAGLLHGNLNAPSHIRLYFSADYSALDLAIYEMGAVDALDAHAIARKNPYAAPEVRAGEAWDQRADIFSFAAFLFEHLTACPAMPIEGGFEDVRLGDALGNALIRALSADPGKRFATWKEFKEAVHKAVPPQVWRKFEAMRAEEEAVSSGDEPSSSGDDEPSSPSGSGSLGGPADGGKSAGERVTRPWNAPAFRAILEQSISGEGCGANENGNDAPSESEKPTLKKSTASEPTPSTLRSEGVTKRRIESKPARSPSATLMRWTPSPIVVYERSPTMVFTRSPAVVPERAPLAVYGVRGKLMKLKSIADSKRLGTVIAALAVAAVVLLALGLSALSTLSKPRALVLAAHSIEMVIPVLARVEAAPMRGNAETKAEAVEAAQSSKEGSMDARGPSVDSMLLGIEKAKALKTNSRDSGPKQSLERDHFIFGEKVGADPEN